MGSHTEGGGSESRILWGELANEAMTALEESTRPQLLAEVRRMLGLLEDDPTQAEARRRRFQNGLWAIPVRGDGEDWVILWEPNAENPDEVVVRYLGPPPGG